MQYTIVIERAPENYAAYVPDLPGCVATGDTREDTVREIRTGDQLPHRELARTWGAGAGTAVYGDRCRRCRRRVTGLQLLGIVENISHLRMVSCAGAGRRRVLRSTPGCSCGPAAASTRSRRYVGRTSTWIRPSCVFAIPRSPRRWCRSFTPLFHAAVCILRALPRPGDIPWSHSRQENRRSLDRPPAPLAAQSVPAPGSMTSESMTFAPPLPRGRSRSAKACRSSAGSSAIAGSVTTARCAHLARDSVRDSAERIAVSIEGLRRANRRQHRRRHPVGVAIPNADAH